MVIRVAAHDIESAKHLVQEFVSLFGGKRVLLQADGENQVEPRGGSNEALIKGLDPVEQ